MAIEHKDILDVNLHEPKGASTAAIDTVYRSDGAGSGAWGNSVANVSDVGIERLVDGLSVAVSQEPSVVDTPIQIEFGPAIGTGSDPVSLDSAGVLHFNQTGFYRIKITLAVGRTGGSGVSELYARVLVNGTQTGQSIHFKVSGTDQYIAYSDTAWLEVPATALLCFEIMRDSAGVNAGGLFQGVPTPVDWATNPCAAIRVERLV